MSRFSIRRIKWTEPEPFRLIRFQAMKKELGQIRWKFLSLLSLCAAAAFAVFIWYMNRFVFDPNPKPIGFYFVGLGSFFWVIFYVMPYAYLWFPNVIRVNSNLILRYGQFRWSQEKTYYVLNLVQKNGSSQPYAVPNQATRDKIEAFLFECGLKKIGDEGTL